MKKYKYKIIRMDKEISESKMNVLGKQGWELCGIISYETFGFTYYIKKEIEKNNGKTDI